MQNAGVQRHRVRATRVETQFGAATVAAGSVLHLHATVVPLLASGAVERTSDSVRYANARCLDTSEDQLPPFVPVWHFDRRRRAHCPICSVDRDVRIILDIPSVVAPHHPVSFASCPTCSTLFQLDFSQPAYEGGALRAILPASLKFYVEQGAGVDILALPPFIAGQRRVQSYLEVGCGFGFGLDIARRSFGWTVHGIDPSPVAEEGRRLLELDIESRYLTSEDARTHGRYNAVAALEVIEHIQDPYEFLEILRSNLAPDGTLVLTTPDANYIEFGKEKPSFLAVLTPGYHAVLFSAKSLETALRRTGFRDVKVETRGATLFAIAGPSAAATNLDTVLDRPAFADYLRTRLDGAEPGSILEIGFGYRLFKELVNRGLYPEAVPILHRLASSIAKRDGIDIRDPHATLAKVARPWAFEEFIAQLPACLASLFFLQAILKLNHEQDRRGALAMFYACFVVADLFRSAMRDFGIDDAETADFERVSREHMKLVLGWLGG